MKSNKRLNESMVIDSDVFAVTSGTTLYSQAINMEGVDQAVFVVSMSTAPAGVAVPITIQQASAATMAQSSLAGALTPACTTQLGSTVANYVYKAAKARISISTASTDGQTVIINDRTYTVSTANAATALQFGATAGASAAGGDSSMVTALQNLINSTVSSIGLPNLTAAITSAASTALELWVNDTASTSITITTTGGGITPSYVNANCKISVRGEALNSTSKNLCAVLGSAATAVRCGLTILRTPTDWREHGITKNHKAT